ncbi:MAG: sigma-70 family RNA polymerase sigma factor [Verrucomicrobiia bacterium]|jgi:RNA polymerase sigma-70 factor (ECF subfamily)
MDGHIDESTRQVTRLWTLAQPKVSAFVTSVVRNFGDRDDLMQDIAVAVFESFDSYDPGRPFVQWAMGVARIQFKNYLRKRQRHLNVFDPETVEILETAFADLPAEEVRELDFLQDCLKKLDGRGRQLCELRYQEDMKPAAISEVIKQPGTAVRKSLQRIREQLRACVERKAATEGVTQ